MSAPMLTPDPSGVAGPGPGAIPDVPAVPAVAPPPPVTGMPQMPGVPLPATHAPGPKGPNFDPTGTVPVAGSPADPNHPAQQAPPAPPQMPGSAEEAAQRRYEADRGVADLDKQLADNAQEQANNATEATKRKADLARSQAEELKAEEARQNAGMEHAQAERQALLENVKDFRFHNYWDTRSVGQDILAGIGIILGSASYGQNHVNEAARTIDNAVTREWDAQKADLDNRFNLEKQSGENARQLRLEYDYQSGKLKLRQEAQLRALADEMDAMAARSKNQAGVLQAQKVAAEARALAEQHGQQGVKEIAEAHSQKLKDAEVEAQTALANAKAGKARRAGAGGGGGGADIAGLNDWLDAHPNASAGDQARAAKQFKIKVFGKPSETTLKSVLAQREITKKDADKTAAGNAKQAAANDKDTVRVGGTPVGLVPSGRGGAVAYGKLLEGYKDSIKSVKDLLAYVEANPATSKVVGKHSDAFHRAVLALQATSTANATDTTTKHEAESLTNLGFLSASAIRTTLEHLEDRNRAYTKDLRPLPGAIGGSGFKNGPAVQEGTTATSGGKPIIFRGGKWVPNG